MDCRQYWQLWRPEECIAIPKESAAQCLGIKNIVRTPSVLSCTSKVFIARMCICLLWNFKRIGRKAHGKYSSERSTGVTGRLDSVGTHSNYISWQSINIKWIKYKFQIYYSIEEIQELNERINMKPCPLLSVGQFGLKSTINKILIKIFCLPHRTVIECVHHAQCHVDCWVVLKGKWDKFLWFRYIKWKIISDNYF